MGLQGDNRRGCPESRSNVGMKRPSHDHSAFPAQSLLFERLGRLRDWWNRYITPCLHPCYTPHFGPQRPLPKHELSLFRTELVSEHQERHSCQRDHAAGVIDWKTVNATVSFGHGAFVGGG